MRTLAGASALACVLALGLAGCESDTGATPSPLASSTERVKPADVSEFESGPESPIAYGLEVPAGATQLGPLVRYRSSRLITAYAPELKAARAQKAVEDQAKIDAAEREGTPIPSTPPTPDVRPSDDTFNLLEDTPKPDTTVSVMRVDGKPTIVVRRMLAQITAALPGSNVVTDDLSAYCRSKDRRITSCRTAVRGLTTDDRDIRITLTVDPGKLATRTSPPSSLTRPVMTVTVEYVGEPRKGQLSGPSGELGEKPAIDTPEVSGLIWPKMDEDATRATKLVNGWTAPESATIILSGYGPAFAAITTVRAVDADLIAEQFAAKGGEDGAFTKDVVEDLNEVLTTYAGTAQNGDISRATYVQSARGNYAMMFYVPAPR